jgi:site-specific DNA-cytosine methylase
MYTFAACQTFAGGFDLGMVQAGFKFIHKVEQGGGFGMPNCVENQHLLGRFTHETGDYHHWHAPNVDVLAANPPCSGFSLMSHPSTRGVDAKVNACMWVLMHYAARVKPKIIIMESVRQAFSRGRGLMLDLRADLERRSGVRYNLFHVMQDAIELGGAGKRPRYFWTAVREDLPFGVTYPVITQRPTFYETISDLAGLGVTWEPQAYRRAPSWWVDAHVRPRGRAYVDGHQTINYGVPLRRVFDLYDAAEACGVGWPINWWANKVARAVYERTGALPASWDAQLPKLLAADWDRGIMTVNRWNPDSHARVIVGGALSLVMHPYERRMLTHREVARVMGFPDDWLIKPLRSYSALPLTWGKGITVQCGKWIGEQTRGILDGTPGEVTGQHIGEREWLVTPPTTAIKVPELGEELHVNRHVDEADQEPGDVDEPVLA